MKSILCSAAICLSLVMPNSHAFAHNVTILNGTLPAAGELRLQSAANALTLIYPEDTSEFGDSQVLYLNRSASVASGAGLINGWEKNYSTSFLIVDKELNPRARVTSITFSFSSSSKANEVMQSLSLPEPSWSSEAMNNLSSLFHQSGMNWRLTTYSPEPKMRQDAVFVQNDETVLVVFISVLETNDALGEQVISAISGKIAGKTLKGNTAYVEPAESGSLQRPPAISPSPMIWSTTATASYWSTYYDGNGAHTVAVWPNTISASRPQFWRQDCVAYSPVYQCISQWSWITSSPAQLGVPDTTWLNVCMKADLWNCPSYADRNNIYNYTADVLYP